MIIINLNLILDILTKMLEFGRKYIIYHNDIEGNSEMDLVVCTWIETYMYLSIILTISRERDLCAHVSPQKRVSHNRTDKRRVSPWTLKAIYAYIIIINPKSIIDLNLDSWQIGLTRQYMSWCLNLTYMYFSMFITIYGPFIEWGFKHVLNHL